jgi:dipeptidyl aminopeptidase/acylaminoacyl peptidase
VTPLGDPVGFVSWSPEGSRLAFTLAPGGGMNDREAEMLRGLSPIHRVDRVKAPTLVLHGANDTNVPVVEAEQIVDGLKKRGVPVEYVLFPDEGHGFRKTPNRIRSTVSIVRWFADHLRAREGLAQAP